MEKFTVHITGIATFYVDVEAENEIEAKGKALALLDNDSNIQPEDIELERDFGDIEIVSSELIKQE